MTKMRKVLTLAACAVLLVCVTVAGTVAYLTSQDKVVNTFTVGNVVINLDETKTDENGKPVTDENGKPTRTEEGNKYKVFPGGTYTKDPTVTVKANSEESYIYMAVKPSNLEGIKAAFPIDKYDTYYGDNGVFLLQMLVDWNTNWEFVTFEDDTYIFLYNATIGTMAGDDIVLPALFTTISLPGDMTNDELAKLDGLDINVAAFAIQADGMTTEIALPEAKAAFADLFKAAE